MTIHEVMPIQWDSREIVTSPILGRVEEIRVKLGDIIKEGQPLLAIKKEQGSLDHIAAGIGGMVENLNVKIGDKVVQGEVLVFIKGDL
ncbi:biotin/lipoyl-binding protein [Halobacillus naozhouensis]|uniref:Biotin/lipoyl-binding protein n=1 Tax=Halobacillus naozhouensis TaxID=554880 RepID=A0ABY8IZ21_9BACI|nr:biotin/lipoyl-binding protein [Halobacillus naozhouensis]WFT75494.1 biotin/lipoyl-binding protein [Halobacillus naozhouensis]